MQCRAQKQIKKEFFEKMYSLIPWGDWVSIIKPIYYKGKVGQKSYAIELMMMYLRETIPLI